MWMNNKQKIQEYGTFPSVTMGTLFVHFHKRIKIVSVTQHLKNLKNLLTGRLKTVYLIFLNFIHFRSSMGFFLWFQSYLEIICIFIHFTPDPKCHMHIFGHDSLSSPVDAFKNTILEQGQQIRLIPFLQSQTSTGLPTKIGFEILADFSKQMCTRNLSHILIDKRQSL